MIFNLSERNEKEILEMVITESDLIMDLYYVQHMMNH